MKKRVIYIAGAIILFLLLLIIGILAYILFTMQSPQSDKPDASLRKGPPITLPKKTTPVGTSVLEIAEKPDSDDDSTSGTSDVAVVLAPLPGLIPTICSDYGSAIRSRPAWRNPTVHNANTKADVVTFTINVGVQRNDE